MALLLLFHSKADFITHFNSQSHDALRHQRQRLRGDGQGRHATATRRPSRARSTSRAILLLIPFLFFFNLWSNWGATLYGEVRGASDFRKNIYAMGGALIVTTIVAVIFFLLFAKTFGWSWYKAANNAYWAGTGRSGCARTRARSRRSSSAAVSSSSSSS